MLDRVAETLQAAFTIPEEATQQNSPTPAASPGRPLPAASPHAPADAVRDAIAAMAAPRLRESHSSAGGGGGAVTGGSHTQEAPLRVMLLCGADLLASMVQPGVWQEAHLRRILGEFGVVAVGR